MLVDIDYDKICQEALTDVGAYAPGEAISSSDQEAVTLRLSQMLTEEFLVKNLVERLKPIYGISPANNESNRALALRLAVSTPYTTNSAEDFAKAAKLFLKFLEGEE